MPNPVVAELTSAITPVVSIGVGSAIWTVCQKNGLSPDSLTRQHVPLVKKGLLDHYERFYASKMTELRGALERVKAA